MRSYNGAQYRRLQDPEENPRAPAGLSQSLVLVGQNWEDSEQPGS